MIDSTYEPDQLVAGAVTGILAASACVPAVSSLSEQMQWSRMFDGRTTIMVSIGILLCGLIARPLVKLIFKSQKEPLLSPELLKAVLLGRAIGIALGLLFGIGLTS
ncbi:MULTISPECIES: hypothetical protein [unclassified Caballeronia]|uniref:hypothetical protein n=1 Tax=unclassified Caballeronia TaxID=2646786 RepID=UPI00202816F6|nr:MULTISPECIES: hypothetical protein [unclassified Caballeronia]